MTAPTTRNFQPVPVVLNRTKISGTGTAFTLVAAQTSPNKRILIWDIKVASSVASTMDFKSGSDSLTGPMSMSAFSDRVQTKAGVDALPVFETNTGVAFNLDLGTSGTIAGEVVWSASSAT